MNIGKIFNFSIFIKFIVLILVINCNEIKYSKIRIYVDYTTLELQINRYGIKFINSVKSIIDSAVDAMSRIIIVPSLERNYEINRCDPNITINKSVLTTGLRSDLIIFPYIIDKSDERFAKTEIYGIYCQTDTKTNRPIAGIIGINEIINLNKTNWLEYYQIVALQALTHIMVFDYTLFDKFIDNKGDTIPLNQVVKIDKLTNIKKVISPKVLKTAKNYFNCDTIDGIPIENYFTSIYETIFWEDRYMRTDLMTADKNNQKVLSEITLALFEDSGWYIVKYLTGGLFKFGKNAKCQFLNKRCIENQFPLYSNEFCNNRNTGFCSSNRLERGFCYIEQINNNSFIPVENQFFSNKNIGGFPLTDYCPISIPFTGFKDYFVSSCKFGKRLFDGAIFEKFGDISFCFMSNLVNSEMAINLKDNIMIPQCLNVICNSNNLTYSIKISEFVSIDVPFEGGILNSFGYDGRIEAPSYNIICTNNFKCNDLFSCIYKNAISNINIKNESSKLHFNNVSKNTNELISDFTFVRTAEISVNDLILDISYSKERSEIDINIITDSR